MAVAAGTDPLRSDTSNASAWQQASTSARNGGRLSYFGSSLGMFLAPAELQQPGSVSAIAGGFRFGLALRTDGTVAAFGNNNNNETANVPPETQQPGAVKAIAGGKFNALALMQDGTVRQWGWLTAEIPPEVEAGGIASDDTLFALREDGTLFGWGVGLAEGDEVEAPPPEPPRVTMTGMAGLKDFLRTRKQGWLALFDNGTLLNATKQPGEPQVS